MVIFTLNQIVACGVTFGPPSHAMTLVTLMSRHKTLLAVLCLAAVSLPFLLLAADKVDLLVINRIKSEAFENSKVMDHMFYLTDVHGPRLTSSPGYKGAADWIVQRMTEYGMAAKEEKWGPFGRRWANNPFQARLVRPQ